MFINSAFQDWDEINILNFFFQYSSSTSTSIADYLCFPDTEQPPEKKVLTFLLSPFLKSITVIDLLQSQVVASLHCDLVMVLLQKMLCM